MSSIVSIMSFEASESPKSSKLSKFRDIPLRKRQAGTKEKTRKMNEYLQSKIAKAHRKNNKPNHHSNTHNPKITTYSDETDFLPYSEEFEEEIQTQDDEWVISSLSHGDKWDHPDISYNDMIRLYNSMQVEYLIQEVFFPNEYETVHNNNKTDVFVQGKPVLRIISF